MDINDFVQPFRINGRRKPQAQVLQDDRVDDGRVRMERRVELAGEGSLDPAGGGEKLLKRPGEVEALAPGSIHEREEMRLPRLGGAPDAVEPVEGAPEVRIVVIARIVRDEPHDPEVFGETWRDFRQSLVDVLTVEPDRHGEDVNWEIASSCGPR